MFVTQVSVWIQGVQEVSELDDDELDDDLPQQLEGGKVSVISALNSLIEIDLLREKYGIFALIKELSLSLGHSSYELRHL